MLTTLKASRSFQYLSVFLAVSLLVFFASTPILRQIGWYLVVEDPLENAAAIVALSGHVPFREIEAAKLYRAGFAPQVVIVRGTPTAESNTLQELGIKTPGAAELSREVLIRRGVPASDILVLTSTGGGTLEELTAVYSAMTAKDAAVILVTSKFHTRRTRLTWRYVSGGRSQPIVRAASGDPFDPNLWWRHRRFALSVVREYLGLVNYYARFAVAP